MTLTGMGTGTGSETRVHATLTHPLTRTGTHTRTHTPAHTRTRTRHHPPRRLRWPGTCPGREGRRAWAGLWPRWRRPGAAGGARGARGPAGEVSAVPFGSLSCPAPGLAWGPARDSFMGLVFWCGVWGVGCGVWRGAGGGAGASLGPVCGASGLSRSETAPRLPWLLPGDAGWSRVPKAPGAHEGRPSGVLGTSARARGPRGEGEVVGEKEGNALPA